MENASKALIIAGAILLSILLISLGIMIFNQASDVTNTNALTDAQKTTFNNKFLKYEGDKVKGASVKSLIQEVIASNSNEDNTDNFGTVTINNAAPSSSASANVKSNASYVVQCDYDTSTGLICNIYINGTGMTGAHKSGT